MIDWSRVNELRDEVGEEDFAEVVELFIEEVDEVINTLRTAPQPTALEEQLHFLKGSALNLGFASFSAICQRGEKTAATDGADTIDIAEILACYDQSKTIFMDLQAQQKASA